MRVVIVLKLCSFKRRTPGGERNSFHPKGQKGFTEDTKEQEKEAMGPKADVWAGPKI